MRTFDLVFGGSSEIGIKIVELLAKNGSNVIFTYNSNVVSNDILNIENVIPFKLDIKSEEDIKNLFQFTQDNKYSIKNIIYNIGKTEDALFYTMTEYSMLDVMNVNFLGAFRISKVFLNDVALNQGSIIFISSISGMIGKIGQVNYSCSKAALIALGRNLAMEYAKLGVKVNCIAPGFIRTKMLNNMPKASFDEIRKNIPLRMLGEPQDVAELANFLISEKNKYITGQTIIIDGGLMIK